MALLTNQLMTTSGLVPTLSQAANCTVDVSSERVFLMVTNGAGAPINVTVVTPLTDSDANVVADRVVAVANGTTSLIGLFPKLYGSGGIATVTFSATTTITSAAIQV